MNAIENLIEVPTLVDQAVKKGWTAGIYDFRKGKPAGHDYFNCGLVERPDGQWLVVRRCAYSKKHELGMNDLMAFKLDNNVPQYGVKIQLEEHFMMEHFEDPRVIYHDGKTYVSCCTFLRNKEKQYTYPHQIICEVDNNWKSVVRYDPVYGHNGKDTHKNGSHEKNWGWFFPASGMPNCLYQISPLEIPWFNSQFQGGMKNEAKEWIEPEWDSTVWDYGHLRGGTPPVLVGNEWITFFHSSLDVPHYRRQYHCGALAFSAKLPYKVTRITIEPLLTGSKYDSWAPSKPLVCFPGNALLKDGTWTVVYGVNDMACGWVKIPHNDLLKRMEKL